MEILISDRQETKIDKVLLRNLSTFALQNLGYPEDSQLSISLVVPLEIKMLNIDYRRKNTATEVLSFMMEGNEGGENLIGDIVLCPAEVAARLENESEDFNNRIGLLLVHSILHLKGYSHKNDNDAKVMSEWEDKLLKKFGYKKLKFI